MMHTAIVKAEEWHAKAIAENIRDADRIELWASSRSEPLDAMLRGMERTASAFTAIYDGQVAAMFGASPYSIMGNKGAAWMIGSKVLELQGAQKDLLRLSVPVLEYMLDQFPGLLYNFVDQRNDKAIRWLKWLGFQFGEAIPYGVDGLPFLPFFMVKARREASRSEQ